MFETYDLQVRGLGCRVQGSKKNVGFIVSGTYCTALELRFVGLQSKEG